MREDYLHFLWEYQKRQKSSLHTTHGTSIVVLSPGLHNHLSGPDFFNSRVVIGDQEWAGNVEIHINSSDWFRHGHDNDPAYNNVILHVVWNHDADVMNKAGSLIPVLELKNLVSKGMVEQYEDLLAGNSKWINCEKYFPAVDTFVLENWLERMYIERLERKSLHMSKMLMKSSGNWEEVFFKLLASNFGLNINGEAFLSMAESLPFHVIRKCRGDKKKLEALFFGQLRLLDKDISIPYFLELKELYFFLKRKFMLVPAALPVEYFRLRPDNFPEIRLSQLAAIYHGQQFLFSKVMGTDDPETLKKLLAGSAARFWQDHYTFERSHNYRKKSLSPAFLELLIINTVLLLKFVYLEHQGKGKGSAILDILQLIPGESNQIIRKFNSLRPAVARNALFSQAIIHLKKEYCDKNRCLQCSLGVKFLQRQP